MLRPLFDPSGTVGRVRYAVHQLGFWGFGLSYAAFGTAVLESLGPPSAKQLSLLLALYGATIVIFLVLLWCHIALWAQRLRDMGWPPWTSLAVAVVISTLEAAIIKQATGVAGVSLSALAFFIALFAWPSRSEARPALTPASRAPAHREPRSPGQFGLRGA